MAGAHTNLDSVKALRLQSARLNMSNLALPPDLKIALESEYLGEIAFMLSYYLTFDGRKKALMKALWELEVQTKQRLLAYCRKQGYPVPLSLAARLKGVLYGLITPALPWKVTIDATLKETDNFLAVFNRLLESATEEDRSLFQYVVDHEIAIKRFAELESQSPPGDSIAPIQALLD